jgi:O-antigen/teichoic acid export membrane protein
MVSRPFGKAFLQTFIGNSLMLVIGAVTSILAARILGPLGRGDLATVFYYPTMLGHLGRLGIHEATAFEVSRRPEDEARLLRAGFGMAVALGLPQVILGVLTVPFLLPADKAHLTVALQWSMILPLLTNCNSVLIAADQGNFRFARFNVVQLILSTAYAGGMIFFWLMEIADVLTFTFTYMGACVLVLIIRVAFSYRDLMANRPMWVDIKCLISLGLRLHLAQLGLIAMNGIDLLVLVSLLPSDQVGLYAAALTLAWGQAALSNALSQVGFVKVAGEADRTVAKTNLLSQFRIAQVITLILMGIFIFMAPYVMLCAFGPAFVPAVPTSYWLIGALGVAGLTSVLDTGFRALGRPWVASLGYGLGVGIMFIGALWLVPTGGILAMAKVRFLSSIAILLIYCLALCWLEGMPIEQLWGLRFSSLQLLWSRTRVLVGSRYSVPRPQYHE